MSNVKQSRGFTLVELLVVLFVVGLLVAFAIPAVQQTRERARQSQCKNNLKQYGLALHNYHDVYNIFPAGYIGEQTAAPGDGHWTWLASILPYLDASPMYNELRVGERQVKDVLRDPQRSRWLQTDVYASRCPSDTGPQLNVGRTLDNAAPNRQIAGAQLTLTNYVAINSTGSLARNPDDDHRGIFYRNSFIGMVQILDGTSNTVMLGERAWQLRQTRPQAAVALAIVNDVAAADGLGVTEGGGSRAADMLNVAQYDSGLAYAFAGGSAFLNEQNALARFGLSSLHTGGVQVLMADASVKLLGEAIEHKPETVEVDSVYEKLLEAI